MQEKLRTLIEWGAKFGGERNIDKLLKLVTDAVREVLSADRCSIFIYDKKTDELWTKVAHGVKEIRVPKDRGIVGHSFTTGQVLNIKDAYEDPRFNQEVDKETGYRTRTILAFPMRNLQNEVIGVFQVINKTDGYFTSVDEEIVSLLSSYAATSFENALLYEELKKAQIETVLHLSVAAEFRDPDTYNHLVRMSNYSAIIAKNLKYSDEEVEKIKIASPMHDIGKLGVPDRILLKPGILTPEERAEMQKHTIYGYDILKETEIDILKIAGSIALSHHEKYDGSGYPQGLKGDAIPIEGRIVALADVFDALTSKRVYKEAWNIDKALKIIDEERGKHFDSKIVDAFLLGLDDLLVIMEKHRDQLT